jgi:ankyrin repeat protein
MTTLMHRTPIDNSHRATTTGNLSSDERFGSMFDTPLYRAAVSGDCSLVEALIEAGHDVNRRIRGHSAIELVINNELRYGTRPLQILLAAGADPNLWVRWKDYFGKVHQGPCLHLALATGRIASARILLNSASTSLHACDSAGRTALYVALGNEETHGTLDTIIREMSILNFIASSRGLPAPAAAWNQMPTMFYTLLSKGLCPFQTVEHEESVFEKACHDGRLSYVYEIIRNYPQLCIRTT